MVCVRSETSARAYTVQMPKTRALDCSCEARAFKGATPCKHMKAAELAPAWWAKAEAILTTGDLADLRLAWGRALARAGAEGKRGATLRAMQDFCS